jgi:hypothetical protein
MDLRLEHAVKGTTMLLQDRFERFEAMTGLRSDQRGTGFAEALVGHDRVPRIVDGIDRGREHVIASTHRTRCWRERHGPASL